MQHGAPAIGILSRASIRRHAGSPRSEVLSTRVLLGVLARRKRSAAVGGGAAERSVQPTRCRAGSVFSRTATREHIRIGYFSGDFYSHPVPHLMAGVIERHDRAGFEVIGYDFSPPADDDYRRGFERAFCRMVPIREMSNHAAVKLIARDEIDIAIGLVGWTKRTRPAALTARPAPVQLQWLGYPGTLGAPWIDYIVWPTAGSFDVKTSTTFPRKSSGTSGPVFDTGLFTRGLERAFHGDLGTPSRRATARPYYPPLIGRWCTP